MSQAVRLLVPSPSAFAFDLRPLPNGGFTAKRKQVRMAMVCWGIAAVALGVAWWLHANPIWSSPAEFEEYGIPLVGGLIFFVVGTIAFVGFSRAVTVDTTNNRVVFERRRFGRPTTTESLLADATLVVAPILTVMRYRGNIIQWNGHVLYIRADEHSFALMANQDPQRVADLAQRLNAEHKLNVVSEAETVDGIDC
ncbi:MAG: hypothetical protein QM783_18375 [Phycisphaerales bacterium]